MAAYQFVYFMDGVSKTYPGGKKVFENIRLNFLPGVKIGVVGVNGTGKSTLLKRVMNELDGEGTVTYGHNVNIAYFAQDQAESLDKSLSVLETVDLVAKDEIRNARP